jgi:hypothetical protein
MTDDYQAELRRTRADATLRMYEGLLGTLAVNVAYAHLLRDAAGVAPEKYEAASFEAREYALAQGRLALLKAARCSRKAWNAMPRNSKQRSDVLLKGAARLGIETGWPGWAEVPDVVTCSQCGGPVGQRGEGVWQHVYRKDNNHVPQIA